MRGLILIGLVTFAFQVSANQTNACGRFAQAVQGKNTADEKLNRFLDVQWKYLMTEYPEWATFVGYPGQNDRWSDASISAIKRREANAVCALKELKKIPRAQLSPKQRVNFDLALMNQEEEVEAISFPEEFMPISHLDGIQVDTPMVLVSMPANSVKDYENILARLDQLPQLVEQNVALMREGLKLKVTPVKKFLTKINPQIDKLLPQKIEDSPLYEPFKEMSPQLSPEDQARLRQKAVATLKGRVYPAFQKLKVYLNTEYIPNAREFIAFSEMPNGQAWYKFKVKTSTTTDMTPDQLHELGIKEVERITGEMEKIRQQVGFKGDLKAFNKSLLTDSQHYYKEPEQLLAGYRDIAKRLDAELPRLFKTLPRLPYGVRPIPAFEADSSPAARYIGGTLEAGRAGFFEANTSNLASRPKWEMETLTMHEAVPGHHFQIAIAKEMDALPDFRKNGHYTAYTEGWALYSESLGEELGFFKDPYSKYGHLTAEMMRALRLVVDTGMHSKGWSKEKALAYYRSNMAVSDSDSEIEIDRYITWPAQALAYKVGQLKFRELRNQSEKTLGAAFDVREFHDEVLRHGALPMAVLEKTVHEWITTQKKKAPLKRA